MSVRVRYAPSPTGLQHIGGVRTALFNYFFARSQGGDFILRIEDTDRERYNKEALDDLYETLRWFNITWDEGPEAGGSCGPYIQSERVEIYQEHARSLVDSGRAYPCYCTSERLAELRKQQEKEKSSYVGYDRRCRDLDEAQRREYEQQGCPSVIRLKVPLEGKTVFSDVLMGEIKRKNSDISPDPVLLKSDGHPTYHLANVVDDHLMHITHIMRAQEWIPSGAVHMLLYQAFGWDPPVFCHLPMVMGKDGQKLSKRHGSTALREFRQEGYLPEALMNYISLLGWSYDDKREFFPKEDLEQLFSLEKLNKAPAVFDYKKLLWFNGQYIRQRPDEELKEMLIPFLIKDEAVSSPPNQEEMQMLNQAMPLIKERLHLLKEISGMTRFFFQDIPVPPAEELIPKRLDKASSVRLLKTAREILTETDEKSTEQLEESFRHTAEEQGVKLGDLLMPVRIAVTGSKASPPLLESIKLLGKEKTLLRLDAAIHELESKE